MRIETDGNFEFDFYLTDRLKLGTVAEMRARMGTDEYEAWKVWVRREQQTAELQRMTGR